MTPFRRAAAAALVTLLGCHDASRIAGPATVSPVAPVTPAEKAFLLDDGPIPSFTDEAQIPSDWCFPRIDGMLAYVYWEREVATYFGRLDYCGNRAEVTLELKVVAPTGHTSGPGPLTFRHSYLEPAIRTLHTGGHKWVVDRDCGYTANLAMHATVRFVIFIDWKGITELFPTSASRVNGAAQPPCTCRADTRLVDDDGSAISGDGGDGGASCGGGSGTSGGSGKQYGPGDYTGGETVDWATGVGNGGSSVCGESAVVEYVCIDIWNEATGRWEEWACGYATTC